MSLHTRKTHEDVPATPGSAAVEHRWVAQTLVFRLVMHRTCSSAAATHPPTLPSTHVHPSTHPPPHLRTPPPWPRWSRTPRSAWGPAAGRSPAAAAWCSPPAFCGRLPGGGWTPRRWRAAPTQRRPSPGSKRCRLQAGAGWGRETCDHISAVAGEMRRKLPGSGGLRCARGVLFSAWAGLPPHAASFGVPPTRRDGVIQPEEQHISHLVVPHHCHALHSAAGCAA